MSIFDRPHEVDRIVSLIETIQQHPEDVLKNERYLMSKKWFDYRFLSPKQANKAFLKAYRNAFRRSYAQEINRDRAECYNGVRARNFADSAREHSQLVIARQRADALGVAYPIYVDAAFDFALRKSDRRKRFPRPNELHGNAQSAPLLAKHVLETWQKRLAEGVVRVEHPAYLISKYRGLPAQDDYRRFVLQLVKSKNMLWHRAIRTFTFDREQVPIEFFKAHIPEDQLEQEMERLECDLRHHPVSHENQMTSEQLTLLCPSCFGMHYTFDAASDECSACPVAQSCLKTGNMVLKRAAAESGKLDPAGDYKRKLSRERQRKCRERKRFRTEVAKRLATSG